MNDDDVLGKADALLSRHRPNPKAHDLLDFPVLTEVVETAHGTVPLCQTAGDIATERAFPLAPGQVLNRELEQLADELRHKVLLAVEPYVTDCVGELLELRARSHLVPAVDRLVKEIAEAAKGEVSELLRRAVEQAVQREIAALHSGIKEPSD